MKKTRVPDDALSRLSQLCALVVEHGTDEQVADVTGWIVQSVIDAIWSGVGQTFEVRVARGGDVGDPKVELLTVELDDDAKARAEQKARFEARIAEVQKTVDTIDPCSCPEAIALTELVGLLRGKLRLLEGTGPLATTGRLDGCVDADPEMRRFHRDRAADRAGVSSFEAGRARHMTRTPPYRAR